MYMMVGIDRKSFPKFQNDLQIVEALVREQSVFCLPGKCFNIPDFFRIVLTVPKEMLVEACDRIEEFCSDNSVSADSPLASAFLKDDSACSSMVNSSEDEEEEEEDQYRKYAPVSFIIRPRKASVSTKLA
jgi:Aminotransferase class I and II